MLLLLEPFAPGMAITVYLGISSFLEQWSVDAEQGPGSSCPTFHFVEEESENQVAKRLTQAVPLEKQS